MAVTEQNAARADDVIEALNGSELPGALKEDLRAVVRASEAATNGYNPDEKIQAISQSLFDLSRITIYNMIHEAKGRPARSWKDVIVEVRWQLCWAVAVVAVVLILRPEIAKTLEAIAQ